MPIWVIWWIVFWAVGLVFPTILLVFTWRRRNLHMSHVFLIPLMAVAVLALTMIPDLRSVLIGADYSHRFHVTVDAITVLALTNAIYAAIRKTWTVALASAVIALAWFYMVVVNSVV